MMNFGNEDFFFCLFESYDWNVIVIKLDSFDVIYIIDLCLKFLRMFEILDFFEVVFFN